MINTLTESTREPVGAEVIGLPPTIHVLVYLAPAPEGARRPAGVEVCDCLLATSEGVDTFSTDRAHDAWMTSSHDARVADATEGWPVEPGLWVWTGRFHQRLRGPVFAPGGSWRRPTAYEVHRLTSFGRPFAPGVAHEG